MSTAPTNILFLPVCVLLVTTPTNADWLDGLEYWDAAPPDGNPIDLAGIRFAMEMRTSPPVATVVIRATTENGFIRVYANTWQFLIPAPVMAGIPPADYVFDLLGFADGYTRSLVRAQVTVLQGITRSVIPVSQSNIRRVNIADGMPYAA
jgi:hypothetical protein